MNARALRHFALGTAVFANGLLAMSLFAQTPRCASLAGLKLPLRCDVTDVANPPKRPGGVEDNQYCFEHVSDADQTVNSGTATTAYHHWLINWHQTNTLDADWKKAEIAFNSIGPRDCATTFSSSGLPPMEDHDAPVLYGRVRDQLTRKNAIVYVPIPATQMKLFPSLVGSVYAGLQVSRNGKQERFVVDIATRSEFKTNQLFLQIENRGDKNLIYSVPDFADQIGKQRFDAAIPTSMWKRVASNSDWFQITGNVNYANLLIDGITTAVEAQVVIRFARVEAPTVVMGRASVPAYVPGRSR